MTQIDQGGPGRGQPKSLFPPGRVLEISFPTFTPRITFRSERELTVEIVAGEGVGFADTVEYETVTVRDGLAILSWRKHDRTRARFYLRSGIHRGNASEGWVLATEGPDQSQILNMTFGR
jgi:hypothetical protein